MYEDLLLLNKTPPGKSLKTQTNETSDTESADIHAASTATTATTTAITTSAAATATTAAATTAAPPTTSHESSEPGFEDSRLTKKFKRLPNFAAFFMRKNEMMTTKSDAAKKKPIDNEAVAAGNTATVQPEGTDGNDNEPKEDNQLVYAELVLKPAQHKEPLPPKNSTEYAEIVYVQKKNSDALKK